MIDAEDIAQALRALLEEQTLRPASVVYEGYIDPMTAYQEEDKVVRAHFGINPARSQKWFVVTVTSAETVKERADER